MAIKKWQRQDLLNCHLLDNISFTEECNSKCLDDVKLSCDFVSQISFLLYVTSININLAMLKLSFNQLILVEPVELPNNIFFTTFLKS